MPRNTCEARFTRTEWKIFWSLLKRAIKGTYVSVMPPHLDRYIDEQSFRFNERDKDDGSRLNRAKVGHWQEADIQ